MRFAREVGRQWVLVDVLDRDLAAAKPLLRRYGFVEVERDETSVQDPSAVDLTRLEEHRRTLASAGIQTIAFSEIDSTANRQVLHRAFVETARDMPTAQHHDDLPFEDFIRQWFERPGSSTAGMFVARDADRIVGLTYTAFRPDGQGEVFDTGVVRGHRRRGIARVLKLMATRYAREQGMARVHTDSNAVNAAMLTLNHELGFRPGLVVITFRAQVLADAQRGVDD
jgi:GNAT superfamily N-acetyltransferase